MDLILENFNNCPTHSKVFVCLGLLFLVIVFLVLLLQAFQELSILIGRKYREYSYNRYEKIYDKGYKEGHKEGYKEGYAKAWEKAHGRYRPQTLLIKDLQKLLKELTE